MSNVFLVLLCRGNYSIHPSGFLYSLLIHIRFILIYFINHICHLKILLFITILICTPLDILLTQMSISCSGTTKFPFTQSQSISSPLIFHPLLSRSGMACLHGSLSIQRLDNSLCVCAFQGQNGRVVVSSCPCHLKC